MLCELTTALNGTIGRVPLRSLAWWIVLVVAATIEIFQDDIWNTGDSKLFTEKDYLNWLQEHSKTPGERKLAYETLEFVAPKTGLSVTQLVHFNFTIISQHCEKPLCRAYLTI